MQSIGLVEFKDDLLFEILDLVLRLVFQLDDEVVLVAGVLETVDVFLDDLFFLAYL